MVAEPPQNYKSCDAIAGNAPDGDEDGDLSSVSPVHSVDNQSVTDSLEVEQMSCATASPFQPVCLFVVVGV